MTTVAKSDLQKDLSEYLERVRAGEELVVTDSGTAVARLVPLAPAQRHDARIQEMIRAGLIRPPLKPMTKELLDSRPIVKDPDGAALKALLEERETAW
jgi:prevent-host-death family protein